MGSFINTKNEINEFFSTEEFVQLTCSQIKKDLQGVYPKKVYFEFKGNDTILDQLIQQLSLILEDISKINSNNLLQFVYQVDVSEKEYYTSIASDNAFYNLAFFIIKREAQKVYLRKKFS